MVKRACSGASRARSRSSRSRVRAVRRAQTTLCVSTVERSKTTDRGKAGEGVEASDLRLRLSRMRASLSEAEEHGELGVYSLYSQPEITVDAKSARRRLYLPVSDSIVY